MDDRLLFIPSVVLTVASMNAIAEARRMVIPHSRDAPSLAQPAGGSRRPAMTATRHDKPRPDRSWRGFGVSATHGIPAFFPMN
jgi:hypothetical protein